MHWELNCRKGNTDSISLADLGGSKALSLSSLASSGVMPSLDNWYPRYLLDLFECQRQFFGVGLESVVPEFSAYVVHEL